MIRSNKQGQKISIEKYFKMLIVKNEYRPIHYHFIDKKKAYLRSYI